MVHLLIRNYRYPTYLSRLFWDAKSKQTRIGWEAESCVAVCSTQETFILSNNWKSTKCHHATFGLYLVSKESFLAFLAFWKRMLFFRKVKTNLTRSIRCFVEISTWHWQPCYYTYTKSLLDWLHLLFFFHIRVKYGPRWNIYLGSGFSRFT